MKKILMITTGGTIACRQTDDGLAPSITADELLGIERKKPDPEDETPRTREQEISVRMSEAFADARKRQEA